MAETVWFEDLRVGRRYAAGPLRVDREKALAFTHRYARPVASAQYLTRGVSALEDGFPVKS
jgi:hypothetical protein